LEPRTGDGSSQAEPSIAPLFRSAAITVESAISLVDARLFPEELAYLRNAVPKRRAEFGTARGCAREALARMGFPPMPLLPGPDRAPVWPAGVVGSISHTKGRCGVVVERSPPVRSVGLDIETVRPLDDGVLAIILTEKERAWLFAEKDAQDDLAILIFCAKEAYYKCQYPLTRTYLGFKDVELEVERESGRFEARLLKEGLPSAVARLEGRFRWEAGTVACGVELGAPSPA
jgi:4'-phosphopantetheinyl transferase EntD